MRLQFAAQLHCNSSLPLFPPLHLPHPLFSSDMGTALHLASCNGRLEVVKALVAAKADVNAKNG